MSLAAEPLFQAKSIALVGATDKSRGGWPEAIYANYAASNPSAELFLVNPKRDELWGRKVYPDFASIGRPVDLALTIIPSDVIPDTLREGAENGLRCAIVFAAQFGEGNDPVGQKRADALLDLRERYGIRFVGPNCMGALALRENLLLYPSSRIRDLPPGPCGVVFQSGGTFQFWLQQAAVRGLGFSYAVSSGNELDLGFADYIDFLIADPHTKLIACMIEGVRKPKEFLDAAARALAAGKPLIVLKIGRSEAARVAAASHTGTMAGDDAVFDAVCRQYGIIRCHTLDEMIETCLAFQAGRLPAGPRIGMVTYSGGAKGLLLDYAQEEGAQLAVYSAETAARIHAEVDEEAQVDNPLDAGAKMGRQRAKFSKMCQLLVNDPNVDLLTLQGQLPVSADDTATPDHFAEIFRSTTKPVIAFGRMAQNVSDHAREFQKQAQVPFLQGLSSSVRALQGLVRYAAARKRGARRLPDGVKTLALMADQQDAILTEHGLTPPRSTVVASAQAAGKAAMKLGFPVALKILSASAVHKTELGGVALGLQDAAAVEAAAGAMAQRLLAADPKAVIGGYLLQEMVSGVEILLGVRDDPLFGPFMIVGAGGVEAEIRQDNAVRLLPVAADDAREMLASLRCAPLLGAFRGGKPRDMEALVAAIVGLSELYLKCRAQFSDIEINPLMVQEQGKGVRAVDVRLIRR
ncbi:MAG TPA: acetate--CoA ligase family protein [Alphaproteobacteria bacterium]|nr:acetate--CoA ligase family protein [Alphaproteobacteria bacterium]